MIPGRDFAARVETFHVLGDVGKDAPRIEEVGPYALGRGVQLRVVHPVGPLRAPAP